MITGGICSQLQDLIVWCAYCRVGSVLVVLWEYTRSVSSSHAWAKGKAPSIRGNDCGRFLAFVGLLFRSVVALSIFSGIVQFTSTDQDSFHGAWWLPKRGVKEGRREKMEPNVGKLRKGARAACDQL